MAPREKDKAWYPNGGGGGRNAEKRDNGSNELTRTPERCLSLSGVLFVHSRVFTADDTRPVIPSFSLGLSCANRLVPSSFDRSLRHAKTPLLTKDFSSRVFLFPYFFVVPREASIVSLPPSPAAYLFIYFAFFFVLLFQHYRTSLLGHFGIHDMRHFWTPIARGRFELFSLRRSAKILFSILFSFFREFPLSMISFIFRTISYSLTGAKRTVMSFWRGWQVGQHFGNKKNPK